MNIETIHWRDIAGISDSWMTKEEAIVAGNTSFNEVCISVGQVIYENEQFLILASTFGGENKYHDCSMILQSVIVNRETL